MPIPQDILLLTASVGETDNFADVTSEIMSRYCRRHGYSFCRRRDGFRNDRPPAWSKVDFILEYLQSFNYVVWMDIDVLIMDESVKLESLLTSKETQWDILVAEEVFPHRRSINSGVMIIRNSLFSRQFFETVKSSQCDPNDRLYEQRIINTLMSHRRVARRVALARQQEFNSMLLNDTFRPGDFLLHFAGVRNRGVLINQLAGRQQRAVQQLVVNQVEKLADGHLSIESALNGFAARNGDIFFLQIGSHDGVTRDPIRRLAERNGWEGVCVEPIAEIYDRLVQNSRYLPIRCINAAVGPRSEPAKMARLRSSHGPLPMYYDQLASLNPEVVLSHAIAIPQVDSLMVEEQVDCVTVADLEAKCNLQHVDLLHIDAEGMDVQILKDIPLDRWQTEVVIFEHTHCEIQEVEDVISHLRSKGFAVYVDGDDFICIHARVLAQCLRKWEVPAKQDPVGHGQRPERSVQSKNDEFRNGPGRAEKQVANGDQVPHVRDRSNPGTRPQEGFINEFINRERSRLRNIIRREGILAEERRYSLFDEELIIRDFFEDRRGGVFVDVGCAWPIQANNTFYLEKHLGWTGIGIDALVEYGPDWHAQRPRSAFFAYLVSDASAEQAVFYRSSNSGLSSVRSDMAMGHVIGASLDTDEIKVPAISLDQLLDREGIVRIDLLAMNIEGHELIALAGFDIDRFQPSLVVVEISCQLDQVYSYFDTHEYEIIDKYLEYDSGNRYFRRKNP
ncbi:hypothetical protein BH11PLA2_BH11PLA2_22540 [soil metagenome]